MADAGQRRQNETTGEYRVLARTYRPGTFDELIGQEAMVRTLANAIDSGRLAHAFVLTGVRGVGKTTTARLIARALNCTGSDGNGDITVSPCGVCDSCVGIAESRHVDVLEMDAASRTGVDDIREIIESVRYAPVSARYKIYIIDEVHMLSKNAFNALLKTLEEPPPHVKFVFATTEIRKLPVTVLSRCQRFDLRRVEADVLVEHLRRITEKESVSVDDEALAMIARAAEGSVRDALSLLDQAIAHSGGAVDADQVRAMLGLADRARILELFEVLMAGDASTALGLLREQYDLGADPAVVLKDLLEVTHWLTRLKVVPGAGSDTLVSEVEKTKGDEMARKLAMPHLTRAWQMLLKGSAEAARAPTPLAAAEMVLIRLAFAAALPTPAELIEKAQSESRPESRPESRLESQPQETGLAPEATGAPTLSPPREAEIISVSPPAEAPPPKNEAAPIEMAGGQVLALKAEEPVENTGADAETLEPMPTTFEALVELFEHRHEGIIGKHLRDDVGAAGYKPGAIEIEPRTRIPVDMPSRMRRCLETWTGQDWQVTVVNKGGAPSLRESDEANEKVILERVAKDPLVKAALETFPGATIVSVTPFEPDE